MPSMRSGVEAFAAAHGLLANEGLKETVAYTG